MVRKPLVSIVVPCYNHENYVQNALSSVVKQTYRPIELVVIDDGSTDSTAERAESFLRKNTASGLFIRQVNSGAANTINAGIKISGGKYINILNSDDSFDLSRIEKCVYVAEQYNLDFIYSAVRYIDEYGSDAEDFDYVRQLRTAENEAQKFPSLGFAFLKNQLTISTGNMFMSRSLIDKVGPFRTYSYVHDWDYALRCLYFSEPFKIKERLYNYRLHSTNSFKSLGSIEGYETYEVMSNALSRLISSYPHNGRAPCPQYWPGVFENFVRKWGYHVYLPPRYKQPLKPGEFLR